MKLRGAILPVCVALGAGIVASAQERVLHEYVPDVAEDEGIVLVGEGGEEPAAIVYDGEVIPPPPGGALTRDEQPMTAAPGDGASREEPGHRSPTYRPDRITSLDGTLGYFEVFTPSIAPFKRVTALDGVELGEDGRTPILRVSGRDLAEVTPEGATAPLPDARSRDRFWGSVVLDFEQGLTVPLPSVSPESRILTVRTEPETPLRIEKDGADNFYATALGTRIPRQVRITYLTDAPRSYFGAPVPDARSDALAGEVAPMAPAVARRAVQFASELGLRRGGSLREALDVLVAHFRSFEESEQPPVDTGDIYLDLSRGKKGVCRHRAYGFVITAQALGIPSRFVQNEAHAWVEVKAPTLGWMRIDLGGAAAGIDAHNADDRPLYRPANVDPFPRPDAYEQSYRQLRQDATGFRPEDRAHLMSGGGAAGAGGAAGGQSSSESPGGAGAGAGGSTLPDRQDGAQPSSATSTDVRPAGQTSAKIAVGLELGAFYREVFRGREIRVGGRARDAQGQGVAGLRVEASLAALRGDRALLLGVTVTRADGYFEASFGVPPDVPVGEYRLVVLTPGDAHHYAATAP